MKTKKVSTRVRLFFEFNLSLLLEYGRMSRLARPLALPSAEVNLISRKLTPDCLLLVSAQTRELRQCMRTEGNFLQFCADFLVGVDPATLVNGENSQIENNRECAYCQCRIYNR